MKPIERLMLHDWLIIIGTVGPGVGLFVWLWQGGGQ